MPASVASAPAPTTRTGTTKATASRNKKTVSKSTNRDTSNGAVVNGAVHHPSPYEIMASRIANRVAEMAESYTFVERPKPQPKSENSQPTFRKAPRKLDIRLPPPTQSPTNVTFSAPFLDNTLAKLLSLQERMLRVSNEIAASEDVDEKVKQEQFNQSAELSRIIALICAEKARNT